MYFIKCFCLCIITILILLIVINAGKLGAPNYSFNTEKETNHQRNYMKIENSQTNKKRNQDNIDIINVSYKSPNNSPQFKELKITKNNNNSTLVNYVQNLLSSKPTEIINLPPIHLPVKYIFTESKVNKTIGERGISYNSGVILNNGEIRGPKIVYRNNRNNEAIIYDNYGTYDDSKNLNRNRLPLNVSVNDFIFVKPIIAEYDHEVLESPEKTRNDKNNPLLRKNMINNEDARVNESPESSFPQFITGLSDQKINYETTSLDNTTQTFQTVRNPVVNRHPKKIDSNVSLASGSDASQTRLFYKPLNYQWQNFGQQGYLSQPKIVTNSFAQPLYESNDNNNDRATASAHQFTINHSNNPKPVEVVDRKSRVIIPEVSRDRQTFVIEAKNNDRPINLEFFSDYHSKEIPSIVMQQLANPGYVPVGQVISQQPKQVPNEARVQYHPINHRYDPLSVRPRKTISKNQPELVAVTPKINRNNVPVNVPVKPIILTTRKPVISAIQYQSEIQHNVAKPTLVQQNQYASDSNRRNGSSKLYVVDNKDTVIVDHRISNGNDQYMHFLGMANLPHIDHKAIKIMEIPLTVSKPAAYKPKSYSSNNNNSSNNNSKNKTRLRESVPHKNAKPDKPKEQFPKRLFYQENAVTKPKQPLIEETAYSRPSTTQRSRTTETPIKPIRTTKSPYKRLNIDFYDEIEILRNPVEPDIDITRKPLYIDENIEINSPKASYISKPAKPVQAISSQKYTTPRSRTTSTPTVTSPLTRLTTDTVEFTTSSPVILSSFDDEIVPTVRPFRGFKIERSRKRYQPLISNDKNERQIAKSFDSDIRADIENNENSQDDTLRNTGNTNNNDFEFQRTNNRKEDSVDNHEIREKKKKIRNNRIITTARRRTTTDSPLNREVSETTVKTTTTKPRTRSTYVFGQRSKPLSTPVTPTTTPKKRSIKINNEDEYNDQLERSTSEQQRNTHRFGPNSTPNPYYDFDYDNEKADMRSDEDRQRPQLFETNEMIIASIPSSTVAKRFRLHNGQQTNARLIAQNNAQELPLPMIPPTSKQQAAQQPVNTVARCDPNQCILPDCRCGGVDIPGGFETKDIPQIVLITFDDAVNDLNWRLYEKIFTNRFNPNGCPIRGTFYVSHEWTDYGKVQTLYSRGHEIASHGIKHSFGEKFSTQEWIDEINGQREILNLFGGVKFEDIRGMRAPFLQTGGNRMFEMLYQTNFTYDSSLPVPNNNPPLFPYTLDYAVNHKCMIPPCPTDSFPGVWEVGMIMWQDLRGGRCSMGDACINPSDESGVYDMLLKNFNRHYKSNRAPFNLFYHAVWFDTDHHRKGFFKFLDEILQKGDVYLITNWQMIQWMRDPTPLDRISQFEPWMCRSGRSTDHTPPCTKPSYCNVSFKNGPRQLRTCQQCPATYPWLGNTGGY